MNYFQAFALAVVEGLTEFLPVSSTGHLVLFAKILGVAQSEFNKSFEIFIQLGGVSAIAVMYWKKMFVNKKILFNVFVAFLPTAFLGLMFYKFIKEYLIGNIYVTLSALFLGGIALITVDKFFKNKKAGGRTMSPKQLFFVGLIQSISMIPGVSRSAASIIGGMMFGLSKKEAVEFSFLLALPTIASATALDLVKSSYLPTPYELSVLVVGFVVSFVVSWYAVKIFLKYIERSGFFVFGVYRIVLAVAYFIFFG